MKNNSWIFKKTVVICFQNCIFDMIITALRMRIRAAQSVITQSVFMRLSLKMAVYRFRK